MTRSHGVAALNFRVLGPLEVWRDGRPIKLGGERQRGLLALLLLHANEVVPSGQLIEQLFGEDAPETAANALQVAISRLRRLLDGEGGPNGEGAALITRPPGYLLRAATEQLDVALFERLLGEGRRALTADDGAAASARLREALALWRGPALADLALLDFVQPEIRRLEELRLTAVTERIEADLMLGRAAELVPELEVLVEANPFQERLRGQLMLALYRSGRQADALGVYRQTREQLRDELGLEPSRALQELERSILLHDPSLEAEVSPGLVSAEPVAVACPFKGLAPFEGADAEYFAGRERVIADLVSRLASGTLVAVVGPSGSGKSSVLRAGLLPALAAGVLPGSERWRVVLLRPGIAPMVELERALGGSGLRAALAGLRSGERLVLAVDQLEEALSAAAEDARAFLSTLTDAALDPDRRAVVAVALRADFYGRCAEQRPFADLLSGNHVLLGPMEPDELARAIELPARKAGLQVERRLVEALVGDVAGEPGGLPLLSTMLLELWRIRESDVLRLETYRALGGVRGVIGRLAEQAYGELSVAERQLARTILLRLAAGDTTLVPRRVALAEFDVESDPDAARVLSVLTEARLLTTSDGVVEVAHEALLHEWPRLREWLEEDREGRRLHQDLAERAREWSERGRDAGDLYRGGRLVAALDWASTREHELSRTEREFLAASREALQRQLRRLRGTVLALVALLALAFVTGVVALVQRRAATTDARVALASKLAAQAVAEPRIDRALLLAREAIDRHPSSETESALLATLQRSSGPPRRTFTLPLGVRPLRLTVSPDGRTLAVSDNGGQIRFFDTATRRERRSPLADAMGYAPPVYSADGAAMLTMAAGDPPPGLQLLDATTLRRSQLLPFDRVWRREPAGAVTPFGLSRDAKTAFFAYDVVVNDREDEGAAYLDVWDVPSARLSTRPLGSVDVVGARLLADGSRLVTVTRSEITTWDTRTLRPLRRLRPGVQLGGYADVSPSGRVVAAELRGSGALVFVDVPSGRLIQARGEPDHGLALTVRFSPDGGTVATSHDDGTVVLWNPTTGRPLEVLRGQGGRSVGAAFGPEGSVVYASSLDGAIFEWGIGGDRRFTRRFDYGPRASSLPDVPQTPPLAVAPDSSQFAVRVGTSRVALYSLATLRPRRVIAVAASAGPITALAWSADGGELAVGTRDGPVQLWRVRPHLSPVRRLSGLDAVQALAFARRADLLAGVDRARGSRAPGRLVVWHAATGAATASSLDLPGQGRSVAFSPDGGELAVGLDSGRVLVVEAESLSVLHTFRPLGAPNVAVAFSADGTLFTGSWAGTVERWDPATGQRIGEPALVAAGPVASISFGLDADRFSTAGLADGRAKLWTSSPVQQLGSSFSGGPGAQAGNAAITPDSRALVAVYDDGGGAVWPVSVDAWKRHACAVPGRNLSSEEWSRFLAGNAYRATCGASRG